MYKPESDLWLSPREVERRVDITRETIRRYCKDGIIAHRKLPNGQFRIHIADVEKLFLPVEEPTHKLIGEERIQFALRKVDELKRHHRKETA
ncbi:helix-turn-helix domain-containing protein [Candidatus Latescibacterota bacterium]